MDDRSTFLQPGERLVLVSNRLPVTLERSPDGVRARLSAGGLATGLSGPHRQGRGPWIGWAGSPSPDGRLDPQVEAALREQHMIGVPLTSEELDAYYNRICNRCLWPLFHYFSSRVTFHHEDWRIYEQVNRRFADAVLEHVRPDDLVFVQDFHLLLVPAMLRQAMPDLRIGFFLHIPFPTSELYRALPTRAAALRGLLGADLIGFHTLDYLRHFRSALRRVLGLDVRSTEVSVEGRRVRLVAQPLGIDSAVWEQRGASPAVEAEIARLRQAAGGRRVILGVDRLDYTKGVPERLLAFAGLLRRYPDLVDEVMMIQVAVPSRVEVEEYRELKDEVDRIAGRINSEFGRLGRVPLHYYFRSVSPVTLTALYRLADVCLVTPLRDGLNLVAKEYVACRDRDDGVLILGEFTGAAWELGEAIQVNPFDGAAMSAALQRALDMPLEEQRRRMAPMRERVRRHDVHEWARACLQGIRGAARSLPTPALEGEHLEAIGARWRDARRRHLFLDYDGTLRDFTATPEAAAPDPELLDLVARMQGAEGMRVWIVSGRPPEVLERWLGSTGVGFVAEHGAFVRAPGQAHFALSVPEPRGNWRPQVLEILQRFTERVPGSRIEEKPLGLAWHYRQADPTLANWQSRELYSTLDEILSSTPLVVTSGSMVIEVRPGGVDKGSAVARLVRETVRPGELVLAAGDDKTDEDVFRALAGDEVTILVGRRPTAARYRLESPAALRRLLSAWLELLPAGAASEVGR